MGYRRRQPISRASTFTENQCSSSSSDFSRRISRFSTFKENSRSPYLCNEVSSRPPPRLLPSSSISAHRESACSSPDGKSSNKKSNSPSSQRFNRSQQLHPSYQSPKAGSPGFQKGLDAINSINYICDTIGNVMEWKFFCLFLLVAKLQHKGVNKLLEEGLIVVENRTAGIISGTRKLHVRRKGRDLHALNQVTNSSGPWQPSQKQADQETQLKFAMAMATKTKLLAQELNTMKVDLAFAKEHCVQLEEENKILRESNEKGVSPEEEDLIRLQLETLLAEKSCLANENSTHACENRFLRGIVDYHQLTMQDVVYMNVGTEEVMEVYPIPDTMVVLDVVCPKPSVLATPSGFENPTTLNSPPRPRGFANPIVLNGLPAPSTAPASTDVVSPDIAAVPSGEDQKQDSALQGSSA